MIRVHDPIRQSCSRSVSGFDLLCTHYSSLNDVWASHLSPLIVPSKDEMERKRFLVAFTLRAIYNHTFVQVPSDSIWSTLRPRYIQPDVIMFDINEHELKIAQNETLNFIYHVHPNGLTCCRRMIKILNYPDNRRIILGYIYGYSPRIVTCGVHNREMWRFDPNQGQWFELSKDDLVGLCPHIQHFLSMHLLTHRQQ
jgi:hypothetical protein